ncbi:MAG: SDR family oxidoreductase [Luteibaculaceae bacterium]
MNISLANKNAFVCGASKGIGLAVAEQLALQGARVCLMARNEEDLQSAVNSLAGEGHQYIVADSSKLNEFEKTINEVVQQFKGFHILVNNSGGPAPGPAHLAEEAAFIAAFNQHLIAAHFLVKKLLPDMQRFEYGRIVNIISTSVKQPLPNLGVSNTVRGAVANWAKTLATELAPYGITVNNVLPGATATDRLAGILENKAKKQNISLEQATVEMQNEIPAKRFAYPDEIANAVGFLVSPAAAYINGINLPVDGGRTSSL